MDFKDAVAEIIAKNTAQDKASVTALLSVPPQGLGDFAYPCFAIAKAQKKNPIDVSRTIASQICAGFIEKVEAKGPYLNIFLAKTALADSVLQGIFTGSAFTTKLGTGTVMVEYSSPNTNKPLHVGHLRNNILGLSISNLLAETGHTVIKANLVNDRGVHICKSMLAYQLYGNNRDPEKEGIKSDHFVGDMYVLFSTKVKEDPTLEEKAQELLKKWEAGDNEVLELWRKMNAWALNGMKKTYSDFGTTFDAWIFESDLFKRGNAKNIIQEGLTKGVFKREDNGAISAVLEPALPNKVLLRGDGTSLYATNDLALTEYKFESFKLDKCIWVVANEQDLYLQQLFAIFKKLGRPWANQCFHLSYGYVTLPSGKMKSREGNVVDADDLLTEVENLARDEIDKRYPGIDEAHKNGRARAIALAGIKFLLLKNDAKKDMVFDKEACLAFEGETGPYVQYTFARARSILRKAATEKIAVKKLEQANFALLQHEKEKELLNELAKHATVITRAWNELSLHPVCHHLVAVAEKFNSFYHEVPVLKSDNSEETLARLALVEATTRTLKHGLELLDIEAIEEM